jgi:hypothetical protein
MSESANVEIKFTLDIYRKIVRDAVECPYCGADKGQLCVRVNNGAYKRSTVEYAEYVHDDRSFAYVTSKMS